MSTAARTSFAVLLALGVILGMSACDVPDPVPTTDPVPGTLGEPTASPTADPDAGPRPVIGNICDDLVPPASLAVNMPPGVVAADPAASQLAAYPEIVTSYVVRAAGGLTCEWNNGEPYSGSAGSNPAYVGIRVNVLPDATTQWARYESIYAGTGAVGHFCNTDFVPLYCGTQAIVGSDWIEAEIFGAVSPAAAATLSTRIVDAVAASGPGAPVWTPPAGTLPLTADCRDTLPETPVGILLGVGVPLVAQGPAGGWSLDAGAHENLGAPRCSYLYEMDMAGVASFEALPAGAWAWREARPLITTPAAPELVEIDFLSNGDEAWVRCTADHEDCYLDLIVGNNWIQVRVWPDEALSESMSVTVDKRDGILRIGEAILGELRG